MKKSLSIIVLFFLMAGNVFAQEEPVEAEKAEKIIVPSVNITAGYVFEDPHQAFKATVAVNNILFKRFGTYTSIEAGDPFFNIYGITASICPNIYVFGGMDLFTDHGLFTIGGLDGTRKEFGIGFIPVSNLIVKGGWSLSVGFTAEVGWRIPLKSQKN
jgi:hypothetical protein